jgi:hypothetical protein
MARVAGRGTEIALFDPHLVLLVHWKYWSTVINSTPRVHNIDQKCVKPATSMHVLISIFLPLKLVGWQAGRDAKQRTDF